MCHSIMSLSNSKFVLTIAVSAIVVCDWWHDRDDARSSARATVHACIVLSSTTTDLYALKWRDWRYVPLTSLGAADVVVCELLPRVQTGVEHNSDGCESESVSQPCKGQAIDVVLDHCHVLYLRTALAQASSEQPFNDFSIVQLTVLCSPSSDQHYQCSRK